MAEVVTGGRALAAAVKDATARNGWRQADLQPQSREVMADDDPNRQRVGLSERTWQDIWRGKKTIEMDSYSYATIDRTLGWTEGTAWALHHGHGPPPNRDKVDLMMAEVEDIRDELREMRRLLDEERLEQEQVADLSERDGVWIPLPVLRKLLEPTA